MIINTKIEIDNIAKKIKELVSLEWKEKLLQKITILNLSLKNINLEESIFFIKR